MFSTSLFLLVLGLAPVIEAFVGQNAAFRKSSTNLAMSAALIVQNKGGGHGELGYQLAKHLQSHPKITSITILQDDGCKDSQEPFRSYATDLPNVRVIKAPLGSESLDAVQLNALLAGQRFDYVWDNASKDATGAGKAMCDLSQHWGVKLYVYVSSAGIYKPGPEGPFPMPETTPVKEKAGQVQLENYASQLGLPLVSFRPQYIYGPKANKHDYLDYFFDRLVRQLPVPIPGFGTQLVSLTCAEDVASLLASPLQNEQVAVQQRIFNCGTDQLISYDDVAHMCASVAGVGTYGIEHYDPELFDDTPFPFRDTDFYVAPDQAKALLGWPGAAHNLQDDLFWYFENYVARGGHTKKMSLVKDWEIVVGSKTSLPEYVGSIYDKYDPLIIEMSNVKNLSE